MISKIANKNEVNDIYANAVEYRGLSTDSKPTDANNGDVFLEINTGNVYIFNKTASEWVVL